MEKKDFYNLIKAVPKAELHLHGEALISTDSIKKLYQKKFGKDMSSEELNNLFSYSDLSGFLDSFIYIQNLYNGIEDLDCVFEDFSRYLEDNNIVYCETFFSPTAHLKKGVSFHDISNYVSKGVQKIHSQGRDVKLIIDVSRSFGVDNAMNNLNCVLQEKNPSIIGIGLGGDENKGPASQFQPVFEKAIHNGLHVVAHAGEVCYSQSIKDSINLLHAERIGHGITAAYDPELMEQLKVSQIPFEVCPTSNVFTNKFVHNISEHPIKVLYQKGLFVTLNTDDPTFFKVSLLDEYWNLYNSLNFSLNSILEIILNGFKAAFISEEKKEEYCQNAKKAWNQWLQAHPDCR